MNAEGQEEKRLFEEAIELSVEERVGYLKGACRDRPEMFDRVLGLLEAYSDESPVLPSMLDEETIGNPVTEQLGTTIGRYKLLEQIGEGGMGVVYMAEQSKPVVRKVALKIIKLGLDTKQVVARFEAERQALAMMDHPSIAKVLDAGATDTGRPYFVMELVRGIPITEYADRSKLSARDRLKLFIPVCHAIQHAHQKGVIHRDIKPSNVMVTLNPDGTGHPMVIDFGVAKATHQKLTEKTLFTNYAQMIGTPAYMSPEQAEMSRLDIDTRTDVYSLGALLYELLTGTTPFPAKELLSKGYGEMQRILAEEEPPRPSNRYSTMTNEQRTVLARNCRMEVSAVSKIFRGDLDWIVMKCLEKDRARRYDTVNGIALDLQRHLDNDLVLARPPSLGYRFQKTWRRNKLSLSAAAAVLVSLVFGIALSAWQATEARASKLEALESLETSEESRMAEMEAKELAKQRLYESLAGEAEAKQFAGRLNYRTNVLNLLQQAMIEGGEQADRLKLRNIAIAALGDFNAREYRSIDISIPNSELACRRRRFGTEYAIGYENGSVEVLDGRTGSSSASLKGGHQVPIHSMLKLSGKDCWVTADVESNIVVWNDHSNLNEWRVQKTISFSEFSDPPMLVESDEQVVIWAQGESFVFLWDPFGSDEIRSVELMVPISRYDRVEGPIKQDRSRLMMAASPDGQFLAVNDHKKQKVWILDLLADRATVPLNLDVLNTDPEGSFFKVSFSPDGRFMLVGSFLELVVYETSDWSPFQFTRANIGLAGFAHAFSADSKKVIYGSSRSKKIWDIESNQIVGSVENLLGEPEFDGSGVDVASFYFRESSAKLLCTLGHQWENLPVTILDSSGTAITGGAFSPDERWLSTSSPEGVRLWNLESGEEMKLEKSLDFGSSEDPGFSHDGAFLASPYLKSSKLVIWDTESWEIIDQISFENSLLAFRFHPRRSLVAAGGRDWLRVWRYQTLAPSSDLGSRISIGDPILELSTPARVGHIQFSQDGGFVGWSTSNREEGTYHATIRVADLSGNDSRIVFTSPRVPRGLFNSFDFLPGSHQVLFYQDQFERWDFLTGERQDSFYSFGSSSVFVSPRNSQFVTNKIGSAALFDWRTGSLLARFPTAADSIFAQTWSKDGGRLAWSLANGQIQIWDIEELRLQLDEIGLDWED